MLSETLQVRMNLEMANTAEMIGIASDRRPGTVTLVPERREERTTEGGLDVIANADALRPSIARLQEAGIEVMEDCTLVMLQTGSFGGSDSPSQR